MPSTGITHDLVVEYGLQQVLVVQGLLPTQSRAIMLSCTLLLGSLGFQGSHCQAVSAGFLLPQSEKLQLWTRDFKSLLVRSRPSMGSSHIGQVQWTLASKDLLARPD